MVQEHASITKLWTESEEDGREDKWSSFVQNQMNEKKGGWA